MACQDIRLSHGCPVVIPWYPPIVEAGIKKSLGLLGGTPGHRETTALAETALAEMSVAKTWLSQKRLPKETARMDTALTEMAKANVKG